MQWDNRALTLHKSAKSMSIKEVLESHSTESTQLTLQSCLVVSSVPQVSSLNTLSHRAQISNQQLATAFEPSECVLDSTNN